VNRAAEVVVDLGAVADNVRTIAAVAAPAVVWAVVKADGYGHGAVEVADAALAGGASGLCVALVQEGVALRRAGITAPVLVLSEQPVRQLPELVAHGLTATVYRPEMVEALEAAVPAGRVHPVHVKVDTGMQRVGVDPGAAAALVALVRASPRLRLEGVFTHLARADEPAVATTAEQLARFDEVLAGLAGSDEVPLVHAANSAGALAWPEARRSLVRVGIAMYGIEPGPGVADRCGGLRPALTLRAEVSFVKRVAAGTSISYGHRYTFPADTIVATVPIGYADGVPRRLSAVGGEVLVGGRRCRIVGVVTMDQLMVDVGTVDPAVAVGDEVVLLGTQGAERIRPEEWADLLDTIGYEIVCGLGARLPRRHVADP
jgi:alanine racemase